MNTAERYVIQSLGGISCDAFDSVKVCMASPLQIRSWSHGEVTTPATINPRSLAPEAHGLFCAEIFGAASDYECMCGKYAGAQHSGVICDSCGVEISPSSAWRLRMGHIELASPVMHTWFSRPSSPHVGTILGIQHRDIVRVVRREACLVHPPVATLCRNITLASPEDVTALAKDMPASRTYTGVGGLRRLLASISMEREEHDTEARLASKRITGTMRSLLLSKLRMLSSLQEFGARPEWMVLTAIPVLPAGLRPMVRRGGKDSAPSDLNDLYRGVISSNNRLSRLIGLRAPKNVVASEHSLLQVSVDELLDCATHARVSHARSNPRSLSESLRGKTGRLRQYMLGKRVDYSGRSVIVVGPELGMNQCGLPVCMALELYRQFLTEVLILGGMSIHEALAETAYPSDAAVKTLRDLLRHHPVLLNRAPTLHKLSVQAFYPTLVEGLALELHPLVCSSFNADFDGDQMAVHVPLSVEAQTEARALMLPCCNLLLPASGYPSTAPSQDMVLGIYYLTCGHDPTGIAGHASQHLEAGWANAHSRAMVVVGESLRHRGSFRGFSVLHHTTTGRAALAPSLPIGTPFHMMNQALGRRELTALMHTSARRCAPACLKGMAEALMRAGFKAATHAGVSLCTDDMRIPGGKDGIIGMAWMKIRQYGRANKAGALPKARLEHATTGLWQDTSERISRLLAAELASAGGASRAATNAVHLMSASGSRGSADQVKQLSGMRGLMVRPDGTILGTPVTSSFREGLNAVEYFMSAHGARKGLADTALRTADSGYLTRRLVDAAHDVVITTLDCGACRGVTIGRPQLNRASMERALAWCLGRYTASDVPARDGGVLYQRNTPITRDVLEDALLLSGAGLDIRSPLYCEAAHGVCAMCYGHDLSTLSRVNMGAAVGVIAAQSIGEPGTQLTMRTFHIGGIASSTARAVMARSPGIVGYRPGAHCLTPHGVRLAAACKGRVHVHDERGWIRESHDIPQGSILHRAQGERVERGDVLVSWDAVTTPVVAQDDALAAMCAEGIRLTLRDGRACTVRLHPRAAVAICAPQYVRRGQVIATAPAYMEGNSDITSGLASMAELFEARAKRECNQTYGLHDILRSDGPAMLLHSLQDEVQSILEPQGARVNNKHLEVIARQMLRCVRVVHPGDSAFHEGEHVARTAAVRDNAALRLQNKRTAAYEHVLLGITKSALNTESFISAASFQETTRVIATAAAHGRRDFLRGIKENVIVGRIIPSGTGFVYYTHRRFHAHA
ncbi:DNA-directed RNA polymerase subunit beta' [Candidatus Tremblaya princeps]|uniref:DNA-directed RNA polymerase subunit n=1 Tax=Tremblaya princeps TaxID=189385 RepID=A0A143WPB9_TREPR|nr:DNA-directed RNA polymerase subunit beta' [Candidatus Tremblaya princeps]